MLWMGRTLMASTVRLVVTCSRARRESSRISVERTAVVRLVIGQGRLLTVFPQRLYSKSALVSPAPGPQGHSQYRETTPKDQLNSQGEPARMP